jgi:hypothetical protein
MRKHGRAVAIGSSANSALAELVRAPYICAVNDQPKNANRERREERLGAALRENLRRRKAQARGRALSKEGEREPHDSAGIAGDKDTG